MRMVSHTIKEGLDALGVMTPEMFESLKDDPQCRVKMLRYGLGRGYGYDEVSSVVDRLVKR